MITEENNVVAQPVDKAKIKHIVKVAVILGIITAFEFAIAFTLSRSEERRVGKEC